MKLSREELLRQIELVEAHLAWLRSQLDPPVDPKSAAPLAEDATAPTEPSPQAATDPVVPSAGAPSKDAEPASSALPSAPAAVTPEAAPATVPDYDLDHARYEAAASTKRGCYLLGILMIVLAIFLLFGLPYYLYN